MAQEKLSGYKRRQELNSEKRKEVLARQAQQRAENRRNLPPGELKTLRKKEAAQRAASRARRSPDKKKEDNRKARQRRDKDRERERKRLQKLARSWERDRDFLAVDGEAVNDRYVLLAASDGSCIESPEGLTTIECLKFLTTRGVKKLWWFAGNYDANMILNGLDITALVRLSWNNRTYYGDFQVDHIPGKVMKIWDRDLDLRVTIWDVFSFVRVSFSAWLKDWKLAPPEEIEKIIKMKDRRAEFKAEEMPEIKEYCFRELKYLQGGVLELMDRVEKTGYHPTHWHSPASISAAVMRKKKIKNHMGTHTEKLEKIAAAAYFGGRFESRVVGRIDAPIFHYDVNSAYPAALQNLPCLECGSWHRARSPDMDHPHTLLLVTWKPKGRYGKKEDRQPWGPLPVRIANRTLRYPVKNDVPLWYWSEEVKAASKIANFKVYGGYRFDSGCDHQPFDWIPEMYAQRQELKRRGDNAEYVLKLILNATYGKLAQRPKRDRRPMFYSPLWAGMVTANCRAQLLNAIAYNPPAVLQLATDGLTSIAELPLPISKQLGDWSITPLQMLFILQSGIYWWKDLKGGRIQKSRGFHPKHMTYTRCSNHWRRSPDAPMQFKTTRFIGYRVALQRNKLDTWRTWQTFPVKISLSPEPRRRSIGIIGQALYSAPLIKAQRLADEFDFPEEFTQDWSPIDQPDGPTGDGGL